MSGMGGMVYFTLGKNARISLRLMSETTLNIMDIQHVNTISPNFPEMATRF